MTLPKQLTTITSLSKVLAAVLFITLPFLGFYLGMEYEKRVTLDFTKVPALTVRTTPKPTADPTANWKIYRNEEYGFELRYPKDYELTASELTTSLLLFPIAISWEVISNERYENYSLSNVIQEELKRDIPYEKFKEIQLNNYNAVTIDFKMVGGNQTKQSVFVKHPDKNLYIRFHLGSFSMAEPLTPSPIPQHIPSDEDFDQILSTFKFTNKDTDLEIGNDTLEVIDGSIYKVSPLGTKEILLNKEDYKKIYDKEINYTVLDDQFLNFVDIQQVSPDKSKIIIFAHGGLSLPHLFYFSLNKTTAEYVGWAETAEWSPNSRYIAFISKPADAGPLSRIGVFDTENHTQYDLSKKHNTKYTILGFSNIRWLDNNSFKVNYTAYDDITPLGNQLGKGEVIINLDKN